jgi:hypothetical protein
MTDQAGVQPWLDIGTAGRLVVAPGATLTVSGTASAVFRDSGNRTAQVTNAGTIRAQAGSGIFLSDMELDNSGSIDVSNAQLSVVGGGGRLRGTGTVSGGQVFLSSGRLAPGSGVGVMHVQSPVKAVGFGILEVELNGPTPGTGYD